MFIPNSMTMLNNRREESLVITLSGPNSRLLVGKEIFSCREMQNLYITYQYSKHFVEPHFLNLSF